MKKIYKQLLIVGLLVLSAQNIDAQGVDDAFGFDENNVEDNNSAAPIDVLVYLGLAAGASLGIRKVKK